MDLLKKMRRQCFFIFLLKSKTIIYCANCRGKNLYEWWRRQLLNSSPQKIESTIWWKSQNPATPALHHSIINLFWVSPSQSLGFSIKISVPPPYLEIRSTDELSTQERQISWWNIQFVLAYQSFLGAVRLLSCGFLSLGICAHIRRRGLD